MAEKVVLPKEVAESLKAFVDVGFSKWQIVNVVDEPGDYTRIIEKDRLHDQSRTLKTYMISGNSEALLSALVNGYEVEQSPEDKLREYYDNLQEAHNIRCLDSYGHTLVGVTETLRILGITIEGINGKPHDK